MECTCGNCPAIRMARGLTPFCRLDRASASRHRDGFGSYSEAAAARKEGQRIKSVGGLGTGGPKRFVLV